MLVVRWTTNVATAHRPSSISQIKDVKVIVQTILQHTVNDGVTIIIDYSLFVFSACNCSALAVSEECDQLTGACDCQDGAQGLKCDDCSYGYIGK